MTWELIQANTASLVRPPRVAAREIEIIREDPIKTVLEALPGHATVPGRGGALATGMRRGELLAFRWSDVDLDRAKLRVERSLEQTKAGLG